MQKQLLRLYPAPCQEIPIKGLYLAHHIHELGCAKTPFIYANFLSSLDGRIALQEANKNETYIPKQLTTDSDFRLFMELHAQADCLITHGGYLRALAQGRLGNILQVGSRAEDCDLTEWRRQNGLRSQPAVVIASASLDFPIHDSLREFNQEVYIATGQAADPIRVKYWQELGYPILFTGEQQQVLGAQLVNELSQLGFKSIYLIAGPKMLDTMISAGQLSRLYHTMTHQLLGGKKFRTLLTGPELGTQGNLGLKSLYYQHNSPVNSGQFFSQYEPTS